jgi:hypothetical protein
MGTQFYGPHAAPYSLPNPAYDTPPLSASARLAGIDAGARFATGVSAPAPGSTSPILLMRVVSGLKSLMEHDTWRAAVLIACNPLHDKYPVLRRIADGFQGNKEDMAGIVDALVRDGP